MKNLNNFKNDIKRPEIKIKGVTVSGAFSQMLFDTKEQLKKRGK